MISPEARIYSPRLLKEEADLYRKLAERTEALIKFMGESAMLREKLEKYENSKPTD